MQDRPDDRFVQLSPAAMISRRTIVSSAARLFAAAALSVMAGAWLAQVAVAQEEIVLTAAASEVGARPGSAYAQGYAALASADQDAGATTAAATTPPPDGDPTEGVVPGTSGRCPRC